MMTKAEDRRLKTEDRRQKTTRRGVALLVVLFIVMMVTVLSLGFMSKADSELQCGQNMVLREQMDALAASGFEHAKGLILNPQDVDTGASEYWTGAAVQQLVTGSDDKYDMQIARDGNDPNGNCTPLCNFRVKCTAYRQKNGQQVGRSGYSATMRLDPCIAYWAGGATTVSKYTKIRGDVWCGGNFVTNGPIYGDVNSAGTISVGVGGSIKGIQRVKTVVGWPGLSAASFSSGYDIGADAYSSGSLAAGLNKNITKNTGSANPAGVVYCGSDVELGGNCIINGTAAINGNLSISGSNNVITAVKNFPALVVAGTLTIKSGGALTITGLGQVGQTVEIVNDANALTGLTVRGALFVGAGGINAPGTNQAAVINIIASPARATLQTWPGGVCTRWRPVGLAVIKDIKRL